MRVCAFGEYAVENSLAVILANGNELLVRALIGELHE